MALPEAIILGLVQGVTEFLPVSSSGHLVIFQNFFGWQQANLLFDVWLHLATLLAVVVFFGKDILALRGRDLGLILVGTLPAALIGLLLGSAIEGWFSSVKVVSLALLVTGLFNLASNQLLKKERPTKELGWLAAGTIGLFQSLALVPGISRAGSTIFGGLLNRLERQRAFKFSFILSIPAILGAIALQLIELEKSVFQQIITLPYLLGGLSALIVGWISLRILERVFTKSRLDLFGWYCLIVAVGLMVVN